MEEEKKDYIKIGKRYWIRDHYCYEHGYVPKWDITGCGNGICYKDEEVFLNEPDEVCYIPECAFFNGGEENMPEWCAVNIFEPRKNSIYYNPLSWTANEIKNECKRFLLCHPKFQIEADEFSHFYFKEMTWTFDKTETIDPWTSSVSLLEAATKLQKQKDEEKNSKS